MNQHLRIAIDHLREGVQVIGFDWRYEYLNETAAAHGQRAADELVGRRIHDAYPGIEQTELFRVLTSVMEKRQPEKLLNRFEYPDRTARWFDLRIEPVPSGICVLSIDVTADQERRERLEQTEAQLRQSQKMEAIGRLAGGIAHDFNNQLTVIWGLSQLILSNPELEPKLRADITEISAAAQRSAALTRQLLAFSRRQVLRTEPVMLADIVEVASALLKRTLGENVVCDARPDPNTAPILGDAVQLEHVLTNLAVNARDAMPDGGRLTITTSTVEFTDEDVRQHPVMQTGRYSVLSVTDTGHGMDEATKAQIFEPFFTTKPVGTGTGLGLSMVYGVVKQMGGFIWVYSEVARGTTFRLYFPVMVGRPHMAAIDRLVDGTVSLNGAGERILLVEDDDGVRDFLLRALGGAGYQVHAVQSAEAASAYLAHSADNVNLLLLDVVLPGQSGPALLESLEHLHKPAVFMSGYSELHVRNEELVANFALLEKPFMTTQLLQAVKGALMRARQASRTP